VSFFFDVGRWFLDPRHWQGPGGIPTRVEEHIVMAAAAMAAAAAVALPVGLILGHLGRGGPLAINLANIGRALPSLAILVLAVQVVGIGAAPAFVALLALAVPPMVTNAYVGMRNVDGQLGDAARGLGMTSFMVLLRIELPNALPVVMAGIRTAGVQVVATATIAALAGWGGLGRFIIDGLSLHDFVEVFAGAVLVAVLAGAVELALALAQHLATPAGLRHARLRGRDALNKPVTF
jgi:osmoprotectant transport system permease protein